MTAASRRKGVSGEREVAAIYEQHGWHVRGLEGTGDHLLLPPVPGAFIHSEVKRAERCKIPEWTRQAEREAPPGTIPVLHYRQNNEPWRVSLRLSDFVRLVGS